MSLLVDIIGQEELTLNNRDISTLREIIHRLKHTLGKDFEKAILTEDENLRKYIIVGLNGKDIRNFNGLDTIINDGDEISFLPAIAGG